MTYADVADLQADNEIRSRIAACAALEGMAQPWGWVDTNSWTLAAQPGWGDAYGYAVANGNEHPGRDAAVVTDAQILTAVQGILATQALDA